VHVWDFNPKYIIPGAKVLSDYSQFQSLVNGEAQISYVATHLYDTLICTLYIKVFTFSSYSWGICLSKLSILLFYQRLIKRINRPVLHWVNTALIAVVACFTIAISLAMFFACTPVDAFWNQYSKEWSQTHSYRCINIGMSSYLISGFSVASDILIATFPLWLLRHLKMPRKQKIAVALILSAGLLYVQSARLSRKIKN
jgi:hypothetical protein